MAWMAWAGAWRALAEDVSELYYGAWRGWESMANGQIRYQSYKSKG